ncbi:TPA: GTP-binding protein, partial [Escherichia coli]
YNDGKKLIPTLQENLRHNKRGLENLLAEQIMFCNRLLLTRNDRLPFDIISAVAKAIHPLNPSVDVLAVSWGNIELSTLLAIPDYNFDRVELLISELEALVGNMDTPCNNEELIWRVIRDDRPFHPQRLWDTCHRFMGMGVYRSKGFFWLPGRDDLALLWNQSAGSISLALIGYWKAGVLEHTDNNLTREERSALQRHIDTASGRFGDRCCQLTIIGNATEVNDFTHALSLCLLTEEEIQWWMSGGVFPDPWPQKVTRLS